MSQYDFISQRQVETLVPLKALSSTHREELLGQSQVAVLTPGQVLFEAGQYDRQHVYLLYGNAELQSPDGSTQVVKGRATLTPLAHQQPRPVTAVAQTDCGVLYIDSEKLDKALSWSQVAEYLLVDISYHPDLDEDTEWMMTVLKSNLFFKVPPTNVGQIFDKLKPMVVDAGEVILRQGEIGDGCYFIKEGAAEVSRSDDGVNKPQPIADIGVGRCFGEDALVNETVRNATVTMTSHGVLMRLDKRDFILLLKEPPVAKVPAKELPSALEGGALLLDVRTDEEYAQGHLRGAPNIPLNLLRLKTRLLDPEQPLITYCNSGRRSAAAAYLLAQQGFQVVALDGGLERLPPVLAGEWLVRDDPGVLLRDGQVVQGQSALVNT